MTDPYSNDRPAAYSAPQAPASTPYSAPPPAAGTNVLAIIALVASFFVPIAGIICGHIALAQIKRTGEQGRGLALAGLIIGYVFTALILLYFLFIIVVIVIAAGSGAAATSSF